MGLVGYCGRVLGNTVDMAFRNVIRFYRLNYVPVPKVDAYLSKWALTVR